MATMMAPSILSADFMSLGQEVRKIADGGADCIHFDVMDGHFVPNLTIGVPFVSAMKEIVDVPLDVHLMVSNPEVQAPWYVEAGADVAIVHVEAFDDLDACRRTLERIRDGGCKAGIAVNPETPVDGVLELLGCVDTAMVMTVHPGFGGQSFIRECLPKVEAIREMADREGLQVTVEVDGGINEETAPLAAAAGANLLVAGSAVFGKPDPVAAMESIRRAADGAIPAGDAARRDPVPGADADAR